MSVTGSWFVGTRAFENSLTQLKEWREATATSLSGFRRWAQVGKLLDDHVASRLAHLERRLAAEKLTIAFVAEKSRGKSELINALFFADLGARLLPAGPGRTTLCPTEILFDPSRPPSIRVLPIETRESAQSLREYLAHVDSWKEILLDPARPETLAAAFDVLSESVHVAAAEAVNLGVLPEEGAQRVEVPRWRYAVVNYPHPLLQRGLVILDTPGHDALAAEPELTLNRVPDADAIIFMASVDAGVTATDRALWVDHIAPIGSDPNTRFIVLNKIDTLRRGEATEGQVLTEIDRHVRAAAEALGVDPTRVFALSARLGLVARVAGDRDTLM
jgi:GTPase SAR1 family protein